MDKHLERIRRAYDMTVEQHRQGIDPLANVPEEIENSSFLSYLKTNRGLLNSGAPDVRQYLDPKAGMRFLDAGCSANIANYRLHQWPSTYFGVDISSALIGAMEGFVARQRISIGGLWATDLSALPFREDFFDIAAVIGVLEYSPTEYIERALRETNRVLKPGARVVLDTPNPGHPHARNMMKLEAYLARPIHLHRRSQVEELLSPLYVIERIDDSQVMTKYFALALK